MKVQSFIFGVAAVLALSSPGFAGYLPYQTNGTPPNSDSNTLTSGMLQDNGFPVGGYQEASNGSDEEGFGTYYRSNSSSSSSPASSQLASAGTFANVSVSASLMYAYVPSMSVSDVLQETVARAPQAQFRSSNSDGDSYQAPATVYSAMTPYSQQPAAMSPWSTPNVIPDSYEAPAPVYGSMYSYPSYGSGYSSNSEEGSSPAPSPYAFSYSIPSLYASNVIPDYEAPSAFQFFASINVVVPSVIGVSAPSFIPPAVPDATGVPEPGTVLLVSSALAGVILRKRFGRR